MSSTTNPSSNFQLILNALAEYAKQTGIDVTKNPFADKIESCNSVEAISGLLQDRAKTFKEYRDGNRMLINCLSPVVQVLHTFSGIIGEALGLVPFPPAKAIFVGVDVLLTAACGVTKSYDALVDLFECVANFLQRLNIYTEIPLTPTMTNIVVKILVEVLSVLALATKQIKQGRCLKFVKKLLGESEIEAVLQRLDRLTDEEARMTGAQTLEVVHGLVNNMRVVMNDGKASIIDIRHALVAMQEATNEINKMKRGQLQEKVRSWLSPPDSSENHIIARRYHRCGTASWFTQDRLFEEWKTTGSLLWIHGKPGSGKSILCSTIIEEAKAISDAGLGLMAYFYFDFRNNAKQDVRGFLTSLLGQLSTKSDSCYKILLELYSRHDAGSQKPVDDELKQCLIDILEAEGQPATYIIVDGLDECPNTGVVSPRERVLDLLEELVDLRLPNLRICATSRPEADIVTALEPLASHTVSLHDQSGQRNDISDYVRSVVHSDRRMRKWRVEDKKLVIDTLVQNADGMFRWVVCQLETLRGCIPASLRGVLHELPETLDETYEHILLGIGRRNREYAHHLLQCLAVAVRPLRVEELAEVLAFRFESGKTPEYHADWRLEDAQDAVLSACSSLITIVNVEGSQFVQFSHFSVKEFLTSKRLAKSGEILSLYHILPQPAHTILAQACLSALLRLDDQVDKVRMQDFPLSIYAARHWIDHAQSMDASSSIQELMEHLFDPDKSHFAAWVWIYDVDRPWDWVDHMSTARPTPSEAVPLYYATLCGFRGLVEHLITSCPGHVNTREGTHATPLYAALTKGHFDIASLLLKNGADVNTPDNQALSPLHRASQSGRYDIVEFLLKYHADVHTRNRDGESSLPAASWNGEHGVVSPRCGVDVDSRDLRGWTPLKSASRYGHLDIVQLLLQNGAAVDTPDHKGWTPLKAASGCGHLEIVQLLLQNGADVNAADHEGSTPLKAASGYGHLEIVRLLLQNNAAVDTPNYEGSTALNVASQYGHLEVVQLLLQNGAAVDPCSNRGGTPLKSASRYGHLEIVQLLLPNGAAVDTPDHEGWTPLMSASRNGHPDIVRLLLEYGADVDVRDASGSTPLAVASRNGKFDVSRSLIERGADVNSSNGKGWTPLHFASQYGHLENVRLLLDHDAIVNVQKADLGTALHLTSINGHSDVAELLIERGAHVDNQDDNKATPLHASARNGHLGIVKFLLESGADVNMRNASEETPLDLALGNGKREVARFLAERMGIKDADSWVDVDVTMPDPASQNTHSDVLEPSPSHGENANSLDNGMASLYTASEQGNLVIVRSLLSRGADANERTQVNMTPLHVASREGRLEVTKLLIQHGADVKSRDKAGWTPLHSASRHGRIDVTRLLLDHGADVNAKQRNQWTPLHLASSSRHCETVKLLLERGANTHVQNDEGRTPSQEALRSGGRDIAQLLSKYGAH